MDIDVARTVLTWCTVINFGILMVWFLVFAFAHAWMQRLHGQWFRLSTEQFHGIHYAAMAVYKIGILLFNLVPAAVLHMVR